ncbi:hypothetical protein JL720_15572 [Aureococcus anophagefferens]|nr:hypothetical protein JL720_15572 [Aureococcus anophagefferens]
MHVMKAGGTALCKSACQQFNGKHTNYNCRLDAPIALDYLKALDGHEPTLNGKKRVWKCPSVVGPNVTAERTSQAMTANKALCNTIMIEPGWRFDDCAKTVLDAVVARPAHSSMWTSYTWLLLVRDPLESCDVEAVRRGAAKFVEAPPSAPRRVAIEDLRRRLLHEEPEPRPRLGSEDRRAAAAAEPLRSATTLELRWLEEAGASSCDASARDAEAAAAAAALARLGEGAAAGGRCRDRGVLVKTVKNDFWSCGVVFDRSALKLGDDAWCWPSGFFAKTEFGVGKGDEERSSFVDEELRANAVPLRVLEAMAARREYAHFGEIKVADVAPYNEVLARGARSAVVAVFARTRQAQHLLLAMAVRDLLGRGAESRLPILVLDASGSDEPAELTLAAQAGLLRRVAAADDDRSFAVHRSAPVLRDLGPFDLARSDLLRVHGRVGLGDAALRAALRDDDGRRDGAYQALDMALRAGNAGAAKAVALAVGADLAGLLPSYRDASAKANATTQFTAFAGRKAVSNRRAFRDALAPLAEESGDVRKGLAALSSLVAACRTPNLRLELLQFVLGLDDADAWTRDRLLGPWSSRSAPSTTAPPRAASFATRTSNGTRPPKADYAPPPLERQLHVA